MRKSLAVPFVAALVGGAVVAAALVALSVGGGETKTVVQQSSISPRTPVSSGGRALTAGEIYKRDAPGVVNVKSEIVQRTQSPFGFPQDQQGEAVGSGFVVGRQGFILTN